MFRWWYKEERSLHQKIANLLNKGPNNTDFKDFKDSFTSLEKVTIMKKL